MSRTQHPASAGHAILAADVLPRAVRLAVGHMRANPHAPLALKTLAAVSGAAGRTLHKQFKTFLGVPPLRYFLILRLNAAHAALRDPAASVTAAAARFGFDHLGRFSAAYRDLHGEPPSETLRRARDPERRGVAPRRRDYPVIAIPPVSCSLLDPLARDLAAAAHDLLVTGLGRIARITTDPAVSGARYRIAGRVSAAPDGLRITIRTIEAATGRQLWGDAAERPVFDTLGIATEIVNKAIRAQNTVVRDAEIARAWRLPVADLHASDLAMRALRLGFMSNPKTAGQALDLLNRAMSIDPDAALPMAMAAWCHAQIITLQGTPDIAARRAEAVRLANRAGVLDPDDALVLTLRGALHTMIGELAAGGTLVARALARDPTSGFAWHRAGWHQTFAGNPERAISHFRRAMRLDPGTLRAQRLIGIGTAHFEAGRYAEAARVKSLAIKNAPDTAWANRTLAVSFARIGETAAARETLLAFRRYAPDVTIGQVMRAVPFSDDFRQRLANGLDSLGLAP